MAMTDLPPTFSWLGAGAHGREGTMSLTTASLADYFRQLADRIERRGVLEDTVTLEWSRPLERDESITAPTAAGLYYMKYSGEYILSVRWFWKDKPE